MNPLSEQHSDDAASDAPHPQQAAVETSGVEVSGVETFSPIPPDAPEEEHEEFYWYMEQAALLISTIKWALLGAGVGILVGFLVKIYLWVLGAATNGASHLDIGGLKVYYLLPFVLPFCVWLVHLVSRRASADEEKEGTDAVITAIHTHSGKIDLASIPVKLLANVLTLAFGGSTGKEGPGAQIGATIASGAADLLRLSNEDRRRLVICGVSAGFAAVFGTPISGALFGVEVLILGRLEYPVLFPCIVSGIIAQLVCGTKAPMPAVPHGALFGSLNQPELVVLTLVFGVLFGLIALLLIETMRATDRWLSRFVAHPYLVAAGGGLALTLLYRFTGDSYSGLGTQTIEAALGGTARLFLFAFVIKIVSTSITLKTGGVGGVVTPLFFIGATSGAALAHLLHLPADIFARFGFIAVVAASANTPIAAAVMGMELLGGQVGVYAALCACTAYLIVGHRSVFASQRIGYSKSAGLLPTLDIPIGEIHRGSIRLKQGSLAYRFQHMRPPRRMRRTKSPGARK